MKKIKSKLKPYHRNIPDADLISDLRSVASRMCKKAVPREEYNRVGKFSGTTFRRRFGSWLNALDRAGLERTKNINLNERELLENLERVWRKLRHQPRIHEMLPPVSRYSPRSYIYFFGSWGRAQKALIEYIYRGRQIIPDVWGRYGRRKRYVDKRKISLSSRFEVMRRDKFKCRLCGASPAKDPAVVLHVDHIKPVSGGGTAEPDNLQTLCDRCNIGKGDKEV